MPPDCVKHYLHHSMPECPQCKVEYLQARVAELEARLSEEVKDRDHWKALAESLSLPMPE